MKIYNDKDKIIVMIGNIYSLALIQLVSITDLF
jgi:hypothetical protein